MVTTGEITVDTPVKLVLVRTAKKSTDSWFGDKESSGKISGSRTQQQGDYSWQLRSPRPISPSF